MLSSRSLVFGLTSSEMRTVGDNTNSLREAIHA
ncbi:hypothetical protein FOMG_05409 [Fusarium oxysporum f. sp. melonis 26406]|uniref:Uncharacterized protein n=1 Tax=Fusarium oxysporum f. sp. melonis 26406 TaxID=1089452 RepID=X0AFJ3_FUSOX|nr:hypothetical protein FOMG_05409 [Fusarium oxysporum f. sp. melonis 26406]